MYKRLHVYGISGLSKKISTAIYMVLLDLAKDCEFLEAAAFIVAGRVAGAGSAGCPGTSPMNGMR